MIEQYRLYKVRMKANQKLNLSETDKAYIAGLIDGEGTIRISHDKKYRGSYWPRVSIANSNENLLKWVKTKIGLGYISKKKGKPHEYWCEGYNVKPLLDAILPYLKVKRKHAELALKFLEKRLSRKRWLDPYTAEELEIVEELRKLNEKPRLFRRLPTHREVMEYLKIHQIQIPTQGV